MGSGKTTYIINYINNHPEHRFLIVVPTNNASKKNKPKKQASQNDFDSMGEVGRYIKNINAIAYEPIAMPSKRQGLKELLKSNKNIVTTHALIQNIDSEIMQLIEAHSYTLIIDETLDCVHEYNENFKKSDLKLLLKAKYVTIENDGFLKWNEEYQDFDGKYENFKNLCNLKSLMVLRKKNGEWSDSIVIWNMPVRFFSLFRKCFILTYLFKGSFQAAYFNLNKISYHHKTIINSSLAPYNIDNELIQRKEKFDLLKFVNFENDFLKNSNNPLTKTWYTNREKNDSAFHYELQELSNNVYNFMRHKSKCKSDELIWTTFKSFKRTISGRGFTKRFLSCNSKGTNDYQNCSAIAYLINLFPPTDLVNFFKSYQVEVNEDLFALSEMLQWIWRSRIRNNLKIDAYIPSLRMRQLLVLWRDGRL